MSSAPTLSLSYRKRGASTWVDIDPATERGARLLHALGLTEAQHPTEGKHMSTTAIRREHVAPLRPIDGATQQERFAFALRMRERASAMLASANQTTRSLLRKIVHTLHLDKAWELAKAAGGWAKDKATWIGRMLGTTGLFGLGMVSISTETGRTVLTNTVGRAAGWGFKALGWGLGLIKGGMRHLGRPGNWAADKIDAAEDWTVNMAVKGYKAIDKRVGQHLAIGSTAMRVTRLGGVLMVAQRAMTAFGLPLPAVYLIGAVTAFWGVYDAADIAIKVGESRGWLKVDEDKATGAKTASTTATATVATPGASASASKGKQQQGSGRRGH